MPTADSVFGTAMITSGALSSLGSAIVVITYATFADLRRLRYVELVFYVSLNDFIASVGIALGPSPNYSTECYYQGFTSNFNYLCSIFWSSVISYQVWLIVFSGQVIKDMRPFHVICWGFPLLLSLLPYSTNMYNNPDDESTWCFVAQRSDSPPWGQLFWIFFGFYLWIFLAVAFSVVTMITIFLRLKQMHVVPAVVYSTLKRLIPYPAITLTCWVVNSCLNLYYASENIQFGTGSAAIQDLYVFAMAIATLQGFFNATAFFTLNPSVRYLWGEQIKQWTGVELTSCCCVSQLIGREQGSIILSLRDDAPVISALRQTLSENEESNNTTTNNNNSTTTNNNSKNELTRASASTVKSTATPRQSRDLSASSFSGLRVQDEIDYIPPRTITSSTATSTAGAITIDTTAATAATASTVNNNITHGRQYSSDRSRILSTSTVDPEEMRDRFSLVGATLGVLGLSSSQQRDNRQNQQQQQQQQRMPMEFDRSSSAGANNGRGLEEGTNGSIDESRGSRGSSSGGSWYSLYRLRESEWWNRSSYSNSTGGRTSGRFVPSTSSTVQQNSQNL